MSLLLPVSCLGACYSRSDPFQLDFSIRSLFFSRYHPAQVILVVDGPVSSDILSVISLLSLKYNALDVFYLQENSGLGLALNKGLYHCIHDIVIRFDTDDISLPDRIPIQYQFMTRNPQISCCGTDVYEVSKYDHRLLFRVKSSPRFNIFLISLFRNPLNHPSVAFRLSDVQAVGGYKSCLYFEDYYLWIRLLACGFKICNLPSRPLVAMDRPSIHIRRNGFNYLLSELNYSCNLLLGGFNYFVFFIMSLARVFIRLIFQPILKSTPWRSAWSFLDVHHDSSIRLIDISLIQKRFN